MYDITANYNISGADTYETVICVGVFGFGPPHMPPLHHIMAAANPSAVVLVSVNCAGWKVRGWDESFGPHLIERGIFCARNCPT